MTLTLSRSSSWRRVLNLFVTLAFVLSTTTVGYASPVVAEPAGEPAAEAVVAPVEQPAEEPQAEPEPVVVPEPKAEEPAPVEAPVSQIKSEQPVSSGGVKAALKLAPVAISTESVRTPAAESSAKVMAPLALVDPVQQGGNPALTAGGIRIDESDLPAAGDGPKTFVHTIGDTTFEFTVSVVMTDNGMEFSFSSPDYPVSRVVAKGGTGGANIYNYNPPVTSDSGLHTPVNPSGKWADISHLDFYFMIVPDSNPAIALEKSVDPAVVLSGETVTYTYVVTNTGDVALHDVEVIDDKLGMIGTIDHLAVGASETLTMDAVVEVDTVNVGTATGYYGEGEDEFVEDSDDAVVDVINPAIDVVKSVDRSLILVGETVTYTYVVTNTGDVDLFDVVLDDDKLGVVGTLESLAVGASAEFSVSTALDVPTTNVVVATGEDEMGHEVTDSDSAFVDVAAPLVTWMFDKSADETTASAGDLITYTLTYGLAEDSARFEGPISIVDDYDETYLTPVDVNGGSVMGGKIYWTDLNEGGMEAGETRTITYTMRIDEEMPVGTTRIDNVATLEVAEPLTDTWRMTVTVEPFAPFTPDDDDPFLPFTGTEYGLLMVAALIALTSGALLRMVYGVTKS